MVAKFAGLGFRSNHWHAYALSYVVAAIELGPFVQGTVGRVDDVRRKASESVCHNRD